MKWWGKLLKHILLWSGKNRFIPLSWKKESWSQEFDAAATSRPMQKTQQETMPC